MAEYSKKFLHSERGRMVRAWVYDAASRLNKQEG